MHYLKTKHLDVGKPSHYTDIDLDIEHDCVQ